MNKRSVLGRGLEALIEPVSTPSGESIRQVPIENIQPNPYQPRQEFDPEKLAELATSIKEHGIIQPLVARQEGTMYTLVAGERRWRAARQAGLTHVPVIIRHLGDEQLMMLALIENLQRENLNPIEEAEAYQRLIDEFSLTQEELAQTLGKSRPAIANALRLLSLPEEIREGVSRETISAGHARALLALGSTSQQLEAYREVVRRGLSVRATENMVRAMLAGKRARPKVRLVDPQLRAMEESLISRLGTQVRITPKAKGGKIEIEYYGPEDLERLVEIFGLSEELA
ncbi:MAG: ParB/RepB/Spo0J family partition protein [Firmicutes bacterium]|jgi:ParB family chromosome partitioning protein|nr:ParB/RepB/Spo0J family partition protein [Bacillota bacterium]HOB21655.1 ParB/RepB/Spo0J family partition protein [Bacillota bacterium]HQD39210.1 ParB/RepB/Spo0J family partition protein [Bacillota bacterium]